MELDISHDLRGRADSYTVQQDCPLGRSVLKSKQAYLNCIETEVHIIFLTDVEHLILIIEWPLLASNGSLS